MASGQVAPSEIKDDILTAHEKRLQCLQSVCSTMTDFETS